MPLRTTLLGFVLLAPTLGAARKPVTLTAPAPKPPALQVPAPVLVPYPGSLLLLDTLEGTRPVEPPARRSSYPALWRGVPAFDPESSAELLAIVLRATERELDALRHLRRLALDRLDLDSSFGNAPYLHSASVVVEFRRRLSALEHQVLATSYRGHALLTGTPPWIVLFQPPPSDAPQAFITVDLTVSALGLSGWDIADPADAMAALDLLDTAIADVAAARVLFLIDQMLFEEGRPDGGLIAIEELLRRLREVALLAAEPQRNEGERAILDSYFQSVITRLDALAARAHFEDIPLLCGGRVCLQGAGALSTERIFSLPDARAHSLEIDTNIVTVDNALGAIHLIDAALAYVSEQRAALERTRDELQRSTPHLR